ncbi:MAG: hypothetical protein ACRCWM_05265 [Sarcina sp.]
MYCMGCGKPINNSNGYCDKCLNENNDIFIDDELGRKNQEPLFNDYSPTQILDSSDTQILDRPSIDNDLKDNMINKNNQDFIENQPKRVNMNKREERVNAPIENNNYNQMNDQRRPVENYSNEMNNNQRRQESNYNNGMNGGYRNNNFSNHGECKYCVACGSQLHVMAKQCPQCGTEAGPLEDNGNMGLAIAGCCIPIVGWILYFVWKDTKLKSAKQGLIGALIGTVGITLFYIIYMIVIGSMIFGGSYYY